MKLKIRTIYFKTNNISALKTFCAALFDIAPKPEKDTDEWVEFAFGAVNLSLLADDRVARGVSHCVPVFE
jgi:hypothetical protein